MTKRKIRRIVLALVVCMGIAFQRPVQVDATSLSGITSSTIQDMREQISNAEKERSELQNSLSSVKDLVAKL